MKKLLVILLFVAPFVIKAQSDLRFNFDYARFSYDSLSGYIEFYYSFSLNNLTLMEKKAGFSANAIIHIQIQDTTGKNVLLDKEWKVDNLILDTSGTSKFRNLVGVVGFVIPGGQYQCIVTGTDANNRNKVKRIVENLIIEPFAGKNLSLSDIELSGNIRQEGADSSSIFYKNTLEVVPNPTMVFGEEAPVVFYYAEIYNMTKPGTSDNVTLRSRLYNSRGALLFDKAKCISRTDVARVEVGTLNISRYATDTYTFVLTALDSAGNYGVSSSKKFYVYNPKVIDTVKNMTGNMELINSEFSALSPDECDELFDKSAYITNATEREQYKKIQNTEGKREFLFKFWKRRDADPSTPENEFKSTFINRVKTANEKYGALGRRGNKTDRGRVFILYGEADETDRYPNDLDKKPYEIWRYNGIEGGVEFIFGDVSGFGDYQLLHSTKRGELKDDNWLSRIQTAK
ncbi:MAG: GWxTD domain-containing protein [Ignavibacteria bacterium]